MKFILLLFSFLFCVLIYADNRSDLIDLPGETVCATIDLDTDSVAIPVEVVCLKILDVGYAVKSHEMVCISSNNDPAKATVSNLVINPNTKNAEIITNQQANMPKSTLKGLSNGGMGY